MTRPAITFGWQINLGHILVAISTLTAGVAAYTDLRRDVTDQIRVNAAQAARLEALTERMNARDVADARSPPGSTQSKNSCAICATICATCERRRCRKRSAPPAVVGRNQKLADSDPPGLCGWLSHGAHHDVRPSARGASHDPVRTLRTTHTCSRRRRAVGFKGFGFYPRSGFIHIDLGPARTWGEPFPKREIPLLPRRRPRARCWPRAGP